MSGLIIGPAVAVGAANKAAGGGGSSLLDLLTAAAGAAPTALFVVETDALKFDPQVEPVALSAINNIGGYDDVSTSIVVDDGSVFRIGDTIQPEGSTEVLKISGITANTLTVARGFGGTTAQSISDNAGVYLVTHTVAADTERAFRLLDQVGDRVYMDEGATNKGGVVEAAAIGTKPALVMDDANSEYYRALRNLAEYGWYGDGNAHTFAMLCLLDAPVLNNSSAYINDGIVGHSAGDSTRPYVTHRNLASDTIYNVAGASGGTGGIVSAFLQSNPGVLAGRHDSTAGYCASIDKASEARTGSGTTATNKLLQLFKHLTYAGGKFAVFVTWAVNLSDAQYAAVVDVLRSWADIEDVTPDGYDEIGAFRFANNYADSATSGDIADKTAQPVLNDYAINRDTGEIIKFTFVSGNIVSMSRAQLGTTAAAISSASWWTFFRA